MRTTRMLVLAAALLACMAMEAGGGSVIYQWRDESGKVHFTDNPSSIPIQHWNRSPQMTALSPAKPAGEARSARVFFEGSQRAIQVPVSINGTQPLAAYLDTGATYCQITREDAIALGLDTESRPPARVMMADGRSFESPLVVLESLRIGPMEIRQVEALVGDLRLLGLNALREFRVTVDMPRGEVILEASNP